MIPFRVLLVAGLLTGGPFAMGATAAELPTVVAPTSEGKRTQEPGSRLSPADKLGMALHLLKNPASTPEERVRAGRLLMDASDEGFAPAQSVLAAYIFGKPRTGSEIDEYAVELAQAAADQGDVMGMSILAIAYAEGRGTERNDEVAQMWRLLVDGSVRVAGTSIDELDKRLTPAVRAKAQARADAWRQAHPPAPVQFPD